MNNDRITKAWNVLREKGWSDHLIETRHKKNVIKDLKEGVHGITQEEIQSILDICLW
jgi:hypothetical protein